MYGYRYRRNTSSNATPKAPKISKPAKVVKEVPAIDAFIAAAAAYRINGNQLVKDTHNNYAADGYTVESVTTANKSIIQNILRDDDYQALFTDDDRREGEAVQAYWRMKMFAILSGNAGEYIKNSVALASLETVKLTDYYNLACIAGLPQGMERGLVRDKQDEIKQDALLLSEHIGKEGDKISGKVKIVSCFYSQKWVCYYVNGIVGTNVVMWASSKAAEVDAEFNFTARIKKHRDGNVTQLNYVKLK